MEQRSPDQLGTGFSPFFFGQLLGMGPTMAPSMKASVSYRDLGNPSGDLVRHVRGRLGATQSQLAGALSLSSKAVQSYEQGWRRVPERVVREMLVLLALNRNGTTVSTPCWEIVDCPEETRRACPANTLSKGRLCWFVASHLCPRSREGSKHSVAGCLSCPVVARFL